eukprot:gene13534-66162_t
MQLSIQLGLAKREISDLKNEIRQHQRTVKDALEGGQEKLREQGLREEAVRLRRQLQEAAAFAVQNAAMDAQLNEHPIYSDAKGRAERERMARQGQEEET